LPTNLDWVRHHCMSMPHVTESVQWGNDLVFKVGGKIFAAVALEPSKVFLAFKCTPEEFNELVERPDVIPAPYAARYHWVGLETSDALTRAELAQRLSRSYDLVWERLTKKARAALMSGKA
jgi:predicted DNA-binding protein (MmcQ/YjbR family)